MTYTSEKPSLPETSDELRARIPGWGADLDPKNRPSVPKLRLQEDRTGAHWEFPERQPEKWPRERSIEHKFLTPVFGTSCPPRGVSGVLRRHAYRKYSEGRAAHWLLLLAADRVDAWESHLRSFLTARPDNPITQTGVVSEFSRHGISSRIGKKRADVKHHVLDPIIVAGPWLLVGASRSRLSGRSCDAVANDGIYGRVKALPADTHDGGKPVGVISLGDAALEKDSYSPALFGG